MKNLRAFLVSIPLIMAFSCEKFEPAAPADHDLLDGPVEGLTEAENLRFLRGDIAFNDEVFIPQTGLGPVFVASSCGSCHPGDGKGHPFTTLTRFGYGNQLLPGAPQLQNRAIPGFLPEVLPSGIPFSKLTPPANTGLGFLDAVSDEDILTRADPNDADGNGISGVPNWINMKEYTHERPGAISENSRYIGRFGKKGAAYDLHQQTAGAYNQDIGITSTYEPVDPYSGMATDPEVSDQTIHDVVFYLKTLKAPIQRNSRSEEILAGKELFFAIGCEQCHRAVWTTGTSPISALDKKTFYPYTDLLLHDMGPALDDGYTEGSAQTSEWKTPPLWGLGLSKFSQGNQYYLLHDGRARSIEEAILMHGGEGQASRNNYELLDEASRKKIIHFLESL